MHSIFNQISLRILVIFKPYVVKEPVHRESRLHANECERSKRGIHCKSGSSFIRKSSQSLQDISIWNEAMFCLSSITKYNMQIVVYLNRLRVMLINEELTFEAKISVLKQWFHQYAVASMN